VAGFGLNRRFRITPALATQITTGGLYKLHIGQSIFAGNLQAAHQLLGIKGVECAGFDRWVVTENDALDIFDYTNANDKTGTDSIGGAPRGQRADLQERGVSIQSMGDTFADRHFALGMQAGNGFFTASFGGLQQQRFNVFQHNGHIGPVLLKYL